MLSHPPPSLGPAPVREGSLPSSPAPGMQSPTANWLLVSMTPLSDYKDTEEALEKAISYKMLFVVTGQEKAISLPEVLAAGTA